VVPRLPPTGKSTEKPAAAHGSAMTTTSPQYRVPVGDVYGSPGKFLGPAELEKWATEHGCTVEPDHANRPSITLADAYRLRDELMQTEAEVQAQREAKAARQNLLNAAQSAREDFIDRIRFQISVNTPRQDYEGEMERDNRAWKKVVAKVLDAERAAGLPEDIQQRLPWNPAKGYAWEVGHDLAYHLPAQFQQDDAAPTRRGFLGRRTSP
jgi:hypothetical protein